MLTGLLCLLVLTGALLVLRVRADATAIPPRLEAHRYGQILPLAAVLLASYPLLRLASGVSAPPQPFWGDVTSHARVAAEMARTGLPNGWIDSYLGGFPFGHHYPALGWVLLAGVIRLGLSPGNAVTALGFTATLGLALALYFGLSKLGVRPAFAALGAILLCWVAPYNSFVGGYETYFTAGLVSQVLVMPICTWLVVVTLRDERRWQAPLFAWLSMAAHPQVTVAAILVLCLATLASGRRAAIASSLRTATYSALGGAALYGQGIATLRIPFGWPPDLGWRQLGFPPGRLEAWLVDGDLLDFRRPPVMTSLLLAAALVLLLGLRRPAYRALLLGLAASLMLGVSGRWLLGWGRIGTFLLSFLQPLRALSLVPPLAAAIIAVGLDGAATELSSAACTLGRAQLGRAIPWSIALLGGALASFGFPARLHYADDVLARLRDPTSCNENTEATLGYDRDRVRSWLRSLRGGRLWYDAFESTQLRDCFSIGGIDLWSAVPTGTAASVGAHVGVLARAAQFLDLKHPGSAARAEALGIGYALTSGGDQPPPEGWLVRQRSGKLQLLEQHALPVGVGCIDERWTGSPERVRGRLNDELSQPKWADQLLDPHRFTAIEYGSGDVIVTPEPALGCDDQNAQLLAASTDAGDVSAQVESPTPVDVVFRFTAFPTWRVWLDGVGTPPPRLVAPGFFAIRVPPGVHQLRAQVSLLPHYGMFVSLAALATALLAFYRGRWGRIVALGAQLRRPRR
jgi:hypothetical protein